MEFNTQVTAHKDNTYSLAINLDYGFMTPDDLIAIAELAKKHNVTSMMATTAKKMSFFDVKPEDVNPLWDDLKATFGDRIRTPKGKIIVCPGIKRCKFAMEGFDNHKMADAVVKITQQHDAGKIKVGVSACPRCCSLAQVRDIGIFASCKGWVITLGGNGGSVPRVGNIVARGLSDEEAAATVDKIYTFIENNRKGGERSARMFNHVDVEEVKAFLEQA